MCQTVTQSAGPLYRVPAILNSEFATRNSHITTTIILFRKTKLLRKVTVITFYRFKLMCNEVVY